MPMQYLLLGLLSIWSLQMGGGAAPPGGTVKAPGGRVHKAVSAEPSVQAAVDLLLAVTTTRVDVFVVIYERLVPVTPELIEKHRDYRISIPGPFPSPLQRDLAFALQTSGIERDDSVESLYPMWGLIFHDFRGERVLTMYFDHWGRRGLINGTPVLMGAEVEQVLQRRIAPLWQ